MTRRVILWATLGLIVMLAAAPGYRWLQGYFFRNLPIYFQLTDFALVDASDRAFTRERLRGKVWVADFIYTRCVDTCPLQTAEMRRLQRAFSHEADFRQLSITADPKHDTGTLLEEYARKFGADRSRWFFLTGSEREIRNLAFKGFRLSYATREAARAPAPMGDRVFRFFLDVAHAHHPGHQEKEGALESLISHSSRFVLIDRNFHIRGYYHSADAASLQKLREDLIIALKS